MKRRRRNNVSTSKKEARLTIPPVNELGENSGSIPTDLLVEILSRLPAKSVARFRCVSKDWASILRRPDFTKHFLTMSSARPRLLFTFQADGKWSFFSTPHSPISDQNPSPIVVDRCAHVLSNSAFDVCRPVCGLVCGKDEGILSGKKGPSLLICNPSVGLFKHLPNVRTRRCRIYTFTGYDPVEKTFKVLGMTSSSRALIQKAEEHQVLTLGTGKPKWRKIGCPVTHMAQYTTDICINGVIYYLAHDDEKSMNACMLVCFDVKSETFKFMINESLKDLGCASTLINYKGKVGALNGFCNFLNPRTQSIELWVIDDIEKQKWSRHVHILPPIWRDVVAVIDIDVVGMIGTSEVVLSPRFWSSPVYIFYFNIEKKTFRRVEIQGIGPLQGQRVYSFVNHVENVLPYEFLSST